MSDLQAGQKGPLRLSAADSDVHLEELVARMTALEDRAYREFAGMFGPRLRSFFLAHGLSISDAEDLAANCVTDIALKVNRYKYVQGGSFKAWVFTLARHALADWWRKHIPTVQLLDDVAADETDPNMEVVVAVREAVAQLPETDQSIVMLRDLAEEHTYAEIGELLSIRPGTVRVRHFRALKRLESILEIDPRIKRLLERDGNSKLEQRTEGTG